MAKKKGKYGFQAWKSRRRRRHAEGLADPAREFWASLGYQVRKRP